MIEALNRDAVAHERGDYVELGAGFDDLAALIPRDQAPRFNKILVALSFWDAWIHARDRGWRRRGDPTKDDWPLLARTIVEHLEADHELHVGQIARFGLRPWRETEKWFREYVRDHPEILDHFPRKR